MQFNPDKVDLYFESRAGKLLIYSNGEQAAYSEDEATRIISEDEVTVYERRDRLGGLLRYGIPNMKLEKGVVERKIRSLEAQGVEFKLNQTVGKNVRAYEIIDDYDAVVLAVGTRNARMISADHIKNAKMVFTAVEYLTNATKAVMKGEDIVDRKMSAKGKNVVIIGGGDTGNDCVGTSVRHGCKSVVQIEMMPKLPDERAENNPWPEWPRVCKTDYGQEEAAAVFGSDPRVYETTVKEFIKDENGKLCAVKTVRLEFVADPETGRRTPREIEGSERILQCELCLIAAGFLGCQSYVAEAFGVELNERTNVKTESGSFSTNVPKVFAAGDMHIGQSLVVRAIREGRDAAHEADEYLMGYTNL